MEDQEMSLRKKAELICSGTLFIPSEITIPFPTSKSSAGPGAGAESIVISFAGKRVKVPISRKNGDLRLCRIGDSSYEIVKKGEVLVSNVTLLPTLCHAPGQAFVCLGRSCIMGCLFCTIDAPDARGKENLAPEKALDMILANAKRPDFEAVAITSGVTTTVDEQISQMARLASMVRENLPNAPIGVEPLATSREHIAILKKAGAMEIKINLEAATREIFENICPKRDYDLTIDVIRGAVEEFGKGAVTSNIIVGLGERDQDVREALEMLAEIGSVGNLRKLRLSPLNIDRIQSVLGKTEPVDSDRLLRLAMLQDEILRSYDLTTRDFRSMCFSCGCCDLIPGIDF